MRLIRIALAAAAVAGSFALAAPASATHGCVELRERSYCVLPHRCYTYGEHIVCEYH